MKQLPVHNLDPASGTEGQGIKIVGGKFAIGDVGSGGSLGGVPVFLLEDGQTVADFETLAGYSIPVPAIIVRKTSSGGAFGWVPVFLLELGQTVSAYETLHGVTVPSPAVIARKTT